MEKIIYLIENFEVIAIDCGNVNFITFLKDHVVGKVAFTKY